VVSSRFRKSGLSSLSALAWFGGWMFASDVRPPRFCIELLFEIMSIVSAKLRKPCYPHRYLARAHVSFEVLVSATLLH
jgi:hypothetical protein